jgi:hypothetical protein
MKWVDGALFDPSLAGVQCPCPSKFPGFYKSRLDHPDTKGFVRKGTGWEGQCGCCGQVGHPHSECEANRWKKGNQEFVNVRWLFAKGFCDAVGSPK